MRPEDLETAALNFEARLSGKTPGRADKGESRLAPPLVEELTRLLHGQERPSLVGVRTELAAFCRRRRLRVPSRATLYRFLASCPPHVYRIEELPEHVRQALYNLGESGAVPGHQLAFYALNYGDTLAMSYAAGLPWLDLYAADRMRGWRPRSHGVLRAILRRRGI